MVNMWDYYNYLVKAIGLTKVEAYELTMKKYGKEMK